MLSLRQKLEVIRDFDIVFQMKGPDELRGQYWTIKEIQSIFGKQAVYFIDSTGTNWTKWMFIDKLNENDIIIETKTIMDSSLWKLINE